jgi:hypothetical protein
MNANGRFVNAVDWFNSSQTAWEEQARQAESEEARQAASEFAHACTTVNPMIRALTTLLYDKTTPQAQQPDPNQFMGTVLRLFAEVTDRLASAAVGIKMFDSPQAAQPLIAATYAVGLAFTAISEALPH